MTYPEAIHYLYGLSLFGANFGLENTRQLAAQAGHPETRLRFIHVAGTNGKGSTCAMLESIYRAAGLRVGLFTSPHLVSFRERIQVGREMISEADVIRLVEKYKAIAATFSKEHHPTFFEVITLMALNFFAEQRCDLVIWETGLGGRLDATNIVTPLASVITNIGLDHQQWLGDTLGKIALEKAGIIKPGVPVATATEEPEALAVIKKVAVEKNAPLTVVTKDSAGPQARLPLSGEHQQRNAALARATVELLQGQIPVSEAHISKGLKNVQWPGRLQLIAKDDKEFLLDGAHNMAGAKALREAIETSFHPDKNTLVLGILGDKEWPKICETLAPLAQTILAVPVASNRTADAKELARACGEANPAATVYICSSLAEALQQASAETLIIITGSLYLVGEALELLGYLPSAANERKLNEWSAQTKSMGEIRR